MNPKELKKFFQENIKLTKGWDKEMQLLFLTYCCKYNLSDKIAKERSTNGLVPATEKQKNFMDNLGIEYTDFTTKQEAHKLIGDKLRED